MTHVSQTSSHRQLARNSIYNSVANLTTVAIGVLIVPYVVRYLGVEQYGIYALLTGLIGYYALLDLGLGDGIVKFVAEYRTTGNLSGIYSSINAALMVQVTLGLLASMALCIFAPSLSTILKVSPPHSTEFQQCLYLIAFGFLFTMISGTYTSVLKGLQRYDKFSRYSMLISVGLNIAIVVALYGLRRGLVTIVAINVMFASVLAIILRLAVKRELPKYKFTLMLDPSYIRKIFSFSAYMFISRLSSTFTTTIVQVIISIFLGPAAVAYYQIPSKLIGAAGSLLASASNVVFPYASELNALNDPERVKRLFLNGSRLFAAIAVPWFLLLGVFSKPILYLWIGQEFANNGWLIMSLLAFGSLLGALTTVPNLIVMGLGHSKVICAFTVFTILFYSALMPIFIRMIGLRGAALAIVAAQLPGIVLICYEAKQILGIRVSTFLRKVLEFHLAPIAISGVLLLVVSRNSLFLRPQIAIVSLGVYCTVYLGSMLAFNWLPLGAYLRTIRDN